MPFLSTSTLLHPAIQITTSRIDTVLPCLPPWNIFHPIESHPSCSYFRLTFIKQIQWNGSVSNTWQLTPFSLPCSRPCTLIRPSIKIERHQMKMIPHCHFVVAYFMRTPQLLFVYVSDNHNGYHGIVPYALYDSSYKNPATHVLYSYKS